MRVYLHHVPWESDPDGFKDRMGEYLNIADKHGISTMFVFLMTVGMNVIMPVNSLSQNLASITPGGCRILV
jgi:hypothetical protein